MGQKVTLGGDRLGSGKKMQTELHNYGMSTHNLSTIFRTTAGAGILYPSLVLVGERDDHFKIKLDQDVRTQPTVAPLFGSFKLQTDFFMCPIRLYQGLLHNNPTELGRQMAQVKLPKMNIETLTRTETAGDLQGKFSDNCLIKYLGVSGIGRSRSAAEGNYLLSRKFNATPMLAYYDIFKNYYSNKQEENAYIISAITSRYENKMYNGRILYGNIAEAMTDYIEFSENNKHLYNGLVNLRDIVDNYQYIGISATVDATSIDDYISKTNEYFNNISWTFGANNGEITLTFKEITQTSFYHYNFYNFLENKIQIVVIIDTQQFARAYDTLGTSDFEKIATKSFVLEGDEYLHLTPFKLANIDQMRYDVLTHCVLGESFMISKTEHNYLPYSAIVETDSAGKTLNRLPLNGLCVKTYQSDLFNNWLNAEWIDGENGVAEISKIVTDEDGAFTIDQLQFAKKIYNLYNRIAISGATYYEWQNVVWSESKQTHVENPVYVGGYAAEICFEEVIQTVGVSNENPLGQLGGKGSKLGDRGGYIEIDCDEACFILAITSITPRISYTQGNEWWMTELDSIDDLHKPEFDGIGFQDLIGERLAYWDTVIYNGGIVSRSKIGKVPAWIDYQTNYDRTYGEFADIDKAGYMVLTRQYDYDVDTRGIKDVTTYIDPSKYNYAFAVTDIDAQNFWLQTNFDIKARRRMSAHLIPQA